MQGSWQQKWYLPPKHPRRTTLGHIVPLARGGPHTRANTGCECSGCNSAKKDNLDSELTDPRFKLLPTN
ncbi:MAG: hypothetical protein DMG28_18955 [Acidobacteria bacterium]|nr:MAG: hypothetical protein DMG28_18955 [Acidobacteriota bacterium]